MWLAIDTVDQGNGCLQYVTGSHRSMIIRQHFPTGIVGMGSSVEWTADDQARAEHIILQPGDLCCHHVCTVHRAAANDGSAVSGTSSCGGRHRRAFSLVAQGVSTGRDEEAYRTYRASVVRQGVGVSGSGRHVGMGGPNSQPPRL